MLICEKLQETIKSTNKTKSITSCLKSGYRWNLKDFMLERQKKLKSGVRYYVANYKNDQDSIITANKWPLINHIVVLLEHFL